jgi:predicted DNA-binding protein (MmcQ/YjbR family)
MNIEQFREYCLSIKGAEEATPFIDPNVLVFKVAGKMFCFIDLAPRDGVFQAALKCDPVRSHELRERYGGITRTQFKTLLWNSVTLEDDVPDELICELVLHSAAEVVKKLPKKKQEDYRTL